ncbi:MAG: hypothetical protein FWC66_08490 [Oscillospiraceae bacterium]|nr:hypothetical protein [Oscillospiraceae bacterium]
MNGKADTATKPEMAIVASEAAAPNKLTIGQQLEAEKRESKERRRKARQAAKSRGKTRYIYSGPYVPGGALISGGIYMEIPVIAEDIIEKIPEVKELFVKVEKYPAFKNDLKKQGTEAYRLYHYVEQSIREGALKDGK